MALDVAITVNGADLTIQPGWTIEKNANGIDVLTCDVLNLTGTRAVAMDDEVVVTKDGTTKLFGGYVITPQEKGFGGSSASDAIMTAVTAHDYNIVTDWREDVYGDRPEETTLARLEWLQAVYLVAYGVTLSGSQMTGVTLPARSYQNEVLSAVLDEICTQNSGAAREIDYDKVLRIFAPSDIPAAFDIGEGDSYVIGDITVTPTRANFATRIILRYNAGADHTDSFTATAGQTTFPLSAIHSSNPGYLTFNGTPSVPLGSDWAVSEVGIDVSLNGRFATVYGSTSNWNALRPGDGGNTNPDTVDLYNEAVTAWGATGNWNGERVVVSSSGWALVYSGSALAGGETIAFTYTSSAAAVAISDNGDPKPRVKVITSPNVSDATAAQSLADDYRALHAATLKQAEYVTRDHGLEPGRVQHIAKARRNLGADFTLISVHARHTQGEMVDYDVTAIEGTAVQTFATLKGQYAELLGTGSSTAASVAAGGTIGGGGTLPSNPVYLLATGVDATRTNGTDGMPASGGGAIGTAPIQAQIDTALRGSLDATVRVRLRALDAGVSVYARLYDATAAAYCPGTSATVTSTTWTNTTFAVTLTSGDHAYELHLFSTTANADIQGSGHVQ